MNVYRPVATAAVFLVSLVGCGNGETDVAELQLVAEILPIDHDAVDILFVIDDSGSMLQEQEQLALWSSELFDVLRLDEELPDLHIGVVSTSMTIPGVGGCDVAPDGRFLGGAAAGLGGSFLIDIDDGAGGRNRNYSSSLTEAFAAMARVGESGCGYEQPFGAIRRALDGSHAENAGFLREDALLLVVVVTDEDDCTAFDNDLFANGAEASDLLGPLSSFRCFEYGVECAEDPRALGDKTACAPRDGSPYVTDVADTVDFLRGLKAHPGEVIVAAITGAADVVAVGASTAPTVGAPELLPSCSSSLGVAAPAVRASAFLDAFPARNTWSSICDGELRWGMAASGRRVRDVATRSPCLIGALADTDPTDVTIQPRCEVEVVTGVGTTSETATAVPRCASSAAGDCYRLVADPARCADSDTSLAVEMSSTIDGTLRIRCRLAD